MGARGLDGNDEVDDVWAERALDFFIWDFGEKQTPPAEKRPASDVGRCGSDAEEQPIRRLSLGSHRSALAAVACALG